MREEDKRGGVATEREVGEGRRRNGGSEEELLGGSIWRGQIGSLVCESMGSQSLPLAVSPLKL